jgi:hypothetical protein
MKAACKTEKTKNKSTFGNTQNVPHRMALYTLNIPRTDLRILQNLKDNIAPICETTSLCSFLNECPVNGPRWEKSPKMHGAATLSPTEGDKRMATAYSSSQTHNPHTFSSEIISDRAAYEYTSRSGAKDVQKYAPSHLTYGRPTEKRMG